MGLCGKLFGLIVAAIVAAVAVYFGTKDSLDCAVLRNMLLTQAQMDLHREGNFDFSYMPLTLVKSCGAEALRMPYPYKVDVGGGKTDDELQQMFFNLKKPTVRVRNIRTDAPNQTLEKLLVSSIGAFTKDGDQELPLPKAQDCLKSGTCALFFDNSWTYDDVQPMVAGTGAEALFAHTKFGNMFCTNLTDSRLTARLHSAPYHGSIAVQMAGIKRWNFWNPATLNKWGVVPDEWTVSSTMQSRMAPFVGQSEVMNKIPHFDVTTGPGELLYFPSHWTHIVWTESGWNNMINLRMCFKWHTMIPAFINAWNLHSFSGAAKVLTMQLVTSSMSAETFKAWISTGHDKAKHSHAPQTHMEDFISLNLDKM